MNGTIIGGLSSEQKKAARAVDAADALSLNALITV
jgi:hypothetical protein